MSTLLFEFILHQRQEQLCGTFDANMPVYPGLLLSISNKKGVKVANLSHFAIKRNIGVLILCCQGSNSYAAFKKMWVVVVLWAEDNFVNFFFSLLNFFCSYITNLGAHDYISLSFTSK